MSSHQTNYRLHIGLFLGTCATTFLSGAGVLEEFKPMEGLYFAATLMTILVCHEMGHFVVARWHGISASLPYFIPLPPGISLGTLGAVIQMESPILDRNKLIDVGAAGPIAGLIAAIPLLLYGLHLSPLAISPPDDGTMLEGNSVAYLALKYAVHGLYLPTQAGLDVQLHPIAFAAWVGLLLTMINLLPIGQLDGGHIACGALADKYERWSRVLHWLLLAVGGTVVLVLSVGYIERGVPTATALSTAGKAGLPWFVWAGLLLLMHRMSEEGKYHPEVGQRGLTSSRRILVAVMAVILILLFTPIPMRSVL